MASRTGLILWAALLFAACGEPPATDTLPTGAAVRDSAGIRIATFDIGPDDLPTVTVAHDPLVLGALEGDGPDVFGSVGAVVLDDERRLYVTDTQADEIRVFASDGTFVGTLGGPGEGPGEFASPIPIGMDGDTLHVWDPGNRRISLFTVDDGFVRAVPIRSDGSLIDPQRFGSGWVAKEAEITTDFESTNGFVLQRDTVLLRAFDVGGEPLSGGVRVPGHEVAREIEAADGTLFRMRRGTTPFMRNALFVSTGPGLIGGPNDHFELRTRVGLDSLTAIWRYPGLDAPPGDAVDAFVDDMRSVYEDNPEGLRAALDRFEGIPLPELRPAFTQLDYDPAGGRLWVRPFQLLESERWLVLDAASGEVLRVVEFPEAFLLRDVRDDVVVGSFRDALEVSYVHVYDMTDPASP